MTDNEIIKALECCSNSCDDGFAKCDECPRFEEGSGCTLRTMKNALDLINRQKAEIERLENELKITREYIHENNLEFDLLSKIEHNSLCETETYESR